MATCTIEHFLLWVFDTLDTVGGDCLCLSMLVEVVTLRAGDRTEAEDTSVLQR